jgi:esterase/lipase
LPLSLSRALSGESSGDLREKLLSKLASNLNDGIDFLLGLSFVDKNNIGIWGRSLGGSIPLICCNQKVKTYVLLSTPFSLLKTFYPVYSQAGEREFVPLPPGTVTGIVKGPLELNSSFFNELESMDGLISENLPSIKNILVIQGDKDTQVDQAEARKLYEKVTEPKRLEIIHGADHRFTHGGEQALSFALQWLKATLVS